MEAVVQANANNLLNSITSWSQRIEEQHSNSSWPMVTLEHFEAEAELTHARQISFHPLVVPDQREQWELYSVSNYKEWIQDSYDYVGYNLTSDVPEIAPYINHGNFKPEPAAEPIEGSPYYAPYWQVALVVGSESLVNFDTLLFDFVSSVVFQLLETNQPMWLQAVNLSPLRGDPESIVVVPIEDKKNNDAVVGVLLALML
jgi:hypothetical protein